MLYLVYYTNGNLRYGVDLEKIRAAAGAETELEVHAVNSPPAPEPVVVLDSAVQP